MFEFLNLNRRKVYRKTDFSTVGFDEPSTILNNSHVNREIRLGDISKLNENFGVREIDDNGLKSYVSPYEGKDNTILNAKYGYSLNFDGKYTFHDTIFEALTEYDRQREEKIRRQYYQIGSVLTHYTNYNRYNREEVEGIKISIFDTTNHNLSLIMDSNGYPIPVDFIQEYIPIYMGKDILSNGNYIFMYKPESYFAGCITRFPRISHGAFYIDNENIVRHHISTQLTSFSYLSLSTANVEKENKNILKLVNKSSDFSYDNWKEMYIYKDDIFHYKGYREYKQQSISINRDRKLSQILDI